MLWLGPKCADRLHIFKYNVPQTDFQQCPRPMITMRQPRSGVLAHMRKDSLPLSRFHHNHRAWGMLKIRLRHVVLKI